MLYCGEWGSERQDNYKARDKPTFVATKLNHAKAITTDPLLGWQVFGFFPASALRHLPNHEDFRLQPIHPGGPGCLVN